MAWIVLTILAVLFGGGALIFARGSTITADRHIGFGIFGAVAVAWLILTGILSIHTVGQRQVGIVYSFSGTITGTTGNGVVLTAPWQHINTENVGIQRENFVLDQSNSAVSSDQQAIYADLSLNYEVLPEKVLGLYQTVGPNWKAILLDSRVLQDFKEVTSGFSAEQITTQRQALRTRTRDRLAAELSKYDIQVVDFFVTNLDYTQTYQDAINAKNVQVQTALQAQAKVAQARAEAAQTVATARGDAKAIELRGAALRNNPEVLRLEAIDKLNPNATVVICSGGGNDNCPAFMPSLTASAPAPSAHSIVAPTTTDITSTDTTTTTGG